MFVIGKIIGLFLHPFYWIVAIIVIALTRKDVFLKKRWLLIAGLSALFFSNSWFINKLHLSWQTERREFAAGESHVCGILLGGYAGWDAKGRAAYFNGSSDRFLETVRLYKMGHIRKILLTGAAGQLMSTDFVESDFAKATLLELGVPAADIFTERRSRNTFENAEFSKVLMDSMGVKGSCVLITSAMHMPRASLIFRKAGVDVRPYPCAYTIVPEDGRLTLESMVPNAHAFDLWDVYLRELAGFLAARLKK